MKVMVMVKATASSEAGVMPGASLLAAMGRFNEELVKAGVMLAGEGLQPSVRGKRVRFTGSSRTIIDGPFAETKELVAGFWLLKAASLDEVIARMKRAPFTAGAQVPGGVHFRGGWAAGVSSPAPSSFIPATISHFRYLRK